MVEKLFILGGNPRRRGAKRSRRPARLFRHARRNPAVGAGNAIPAFLRKGMKPIRDRQARRRNKRGGLRAGSPEALAWGRKMKRARYRKLHPAAKHAKKRSVAKKSTRKGVRHMAKRHKRHGGMKKGSAAAKAWGRKMKRLRAGKHVGKKRHYKKHTVKAPKRHYKKHSGAGRRHYHKRMKVRKIMVPAAWGKGYRRRGYKRIKVLSNPSGKLFSWLKFGGLVLAGFAGATAFNKLINTYVLKSKPQPAWLTGLVLSAAAILFGKKVWKKMPESFITGIVTNTLVSAVAQFAPKYLEWVIPSGAASLALPAGTSFYPALDKYVPSGDALMDYGNPYNSFGGDSNPLTASPFAGGIY